MTPATDNEVAAAKDTIGCHLAFHKKVSGQGGGGRDLVGQRVVILLRHPVDIGWTSCEEQRGTSLLDLICHAVHQYGTKLFQHRLPVHCLASTNLAAMHRHVNAMELVRNRCH